MSDEEIWIACEPPTFCSPIARLRWLKSERNDWERVLQQEWQYEQAGKYWTEWQDVPTEDEP